MAALAAHLSMTRLLHKCIAYQRTLDLNLDHLFSQRLDLDKHLSNLQKSSQVLDIVKSEADHVLSTCDLADHFSVKVRELDLTQPGVNSTLLLLDEIVEQFLGA